MSKRVAAIAQKLLKWYDAHRRDLPWRAAPGEKPDPYRVWLSEIMLQQTTVATVIGYYGDFVARWPKVEDLAKAELDDVLHAWQGLGYYSRARNLHKCARQVTGEHGGIFPETEAELVKLPGVGPYTSAAIAAIAYGRKATPVDGNIERVMARLHAIETPLPAAKPEIRTIAEGLTPEQRAGDFAQALMDLGATVCRPKAPDCDVCPLEADCVARMGGEAGRYPLRAPKKPKPTRFGVVYWLEREDGAVLVQRRPESGLLGGMMEFPSTPWGDSLPDADGIVDHAPMPTDWQRIEGDVEHVFTHFRLCLGILFGRTNSDGGNHRWCHPKDFASLALPTVMKKVARRVADYES